MAEGSRAPVEPAPPPPAPGGTRERILDALGDPVARQILLMLSDQPRSAPDLLKTNHIPQSTLYRKLHDLQTLGLVGIQRSAITEDGKRVELFRSRLEELRVELRGASLRIDVRFRDLAAERLHDLWSDLKREVRR
jgi:DNA-binding transcriptional ArsR family regulator